MKDIMKIVKPFKDSRLLIKGVYETVRNETKEQRSGFFGILLGILGARLLENVLRAKEL